MEEDKHGRRGEELHLDRVYMERGTDTYLRRNFLWWRNDRAVLTHVTWAAEF